MHIDDFIDGGYRKNSYARWVLNHFRLPASLRLDFDEFMEPHKLFCTWHGARYRVTGASQMGYVWLAVNHRRNQGYDHRVDVATCSDWSATP